MVLPIENASSSSGPLEEVSDTPKLSTTLPEEIVEVIADSTLKRKASLNHNIFLTILLKKCGLFMKGLCFHPDYPYLNVFHIHDLYRFPKEALCFFWYLFEVHTIAISFNSLKLLSYVMQCKYGELPPQSKHLMTMLRWFLPDYQWLSKLTICCRTYVVFMFRRPVSFIPPTLIEGQNNPQAIVHHHPSIFIQDWYDFNPANINCRMRNPSSYLNLRCILANANDRDPSSIPRDIMFQYTTWPDDHPISKEWIKAEAEWRRTHLEYLVDSSEEEMGSTLSDEDDSGDDDDPPHHDPYEDDPSHPDSHWK